MTTTTDTEKARAIQIDVPCYCTGSNYLCENHRPIAAAIAKEREATWKKAIMVAIDATETHDSTATAGLRGTIVGRLKEEAALAARKEGNTNHE